MSWEPVRWVLRCDGQLLTGQCAEVLQTDAEDDLFAEPDQLLDTHFPTPALDRIDRYGLRVAGWLDLSDGRVLCPRHVAGQLHMVHASIEGLPFPDIDPTQTGPDGSNR
jgi:hypothetical protein